MIRINLFVVSFSLLIQIYYTAFSTLPIYIANPYFQSVAAEVKSDVTTTFGSANPITKTIPFTKTYTQIPQLAYAIKNYRGNDRLFQQDFAMTRMALTNTGFTVYTMINGTTNIRIFTIMYLAVDRSFAYHINLFNDVQVNYTQGPLTNLSGSDIGIRTYTNVINYTTLASGISSTYTKFGSILSKNYVALYLSAIYNGGSNIVPLPEVKYSVTTQILSIDQFQIKIVVQPGYKVSLLRFGIVTVDVDDIQKSFNTTVIFFFSNLDGTINNYINLPSQFLNSALIGLLDYSAATPNSGLQFNWQPDPANSRIVVNKSIPHSGSSALAGLKSYQISIFYVRSWQCPTSHVYFDFDTMLCYQLICGDGYWLTARQYCDDYNFDNYDGCDQNCAVQKDFECSLTDRLPNGTSFCKYTKNITLQFTYYQKQPTSNTLHIYFTMTPTLLKNLNQLSIQNLITTIQISQPNNPNITIIPSTNISIIFYPNLSNNQIQMIVLFDHATIQFKDLTFKIQPNNTPTIPSILHLPTINHTLNINSGNDAIGYYNYDNKMYSQYQRYPLKIMSQIIGLVCLVIMIIGLLCPIGKLIVIQCLAVIQLSFFSLIQLVKVSPNYEQLKYLIYSTGYYDITQMIYMNKESYDRTIYGLMGIKKTIIKNYNYSLGLFFVPLILGLIGLCIVPIIRRIKTKQIKQLKKQQNLLTYKQGIIKQRLKQIQNYHKINHKNYSQTTNNNNIFAIPLNTHLDGQQQKQRQNQINYNRATHRLQFISQLSKRIILQYCMYGLLVCSYLLWISVLFTKGSNINLNIIVYSIICFIWLLYIVLFYKYDSTPIDLNKYTTALQLPQYKLINNHFYTGFGQFRQVSVLITHQKITKHNHNQHKLYIILILERFVSSTLIVFASPYFLFTPALIILIYVFFLILLNIIRNKYQNLLYNKQKKSIFSYIYQNYVLRQSINFITVIIVQLFILSFQILKATQGYQIALSKNKFTTVMIPYIILGIVVINILINLFFWIWQIINSQIIIKCKLFLQIIFPSKYTANDSYQINKYLIDYNSDKQDYKNQLLQKQTQKKWQKNIKIQINNEQDLMSQAISSFKFIFLKVWYCDEGMVLLQIIRAFMEFFYCLQKYHLSLIHHFYFIYRFYKHILEQYVTLLIYMSNLIWPQVQHSQKCKRYVIFRVMVQYFVKLF